MYNNGFDFSFPYDFRSNADKERDAHFEAFRDGLNNDCHCGDCEYWREIEGQDLEKV